MQNVELKTVSKKPKDI